MSKLGPASEILASLHSNFPPVSGPLIASAAGHWVAVSVFETATMCSSSRLVALVLLCGANAWPVIRTWSDVLYGSILRRNNDTYNDNSHTSRGKVSKGLTVQFKQH
jgi:hypothetical protein